MAEETNAKSDSDRPRDHHPSDQRRHDPARLDKARRLLEQARRCHLAGRLNEAQPLYGKVLANQPDNGNALHGLGVLALQRGQNQEALEIVSRAVAADPADWRYQCTMGQILVSMSRLEEAETVYRRAVELRPQAVEVHFGLGLALHARGRRADAICAYRTVLELNPSHIEARNNLGNALQTEGRLEEGIAEYRQVLALRPDYVEAQNNLGSALQTVGRLDEAIASLRAGLARQPDFVPLHNNLANALTSAGQFSEAAAVLRRGLALHPDFPQAWYNLGNVLRETGAYAESADAFRRAIKLNPAYVQAHINLGNVLQTLGDFKASAEAYVLAMKAKPDCVDAYTNVGAALQKMGHIDPAIEVLQRGLALRPDFNVAHCNLGNLLKDAGRLDEALASYRRAVECKKSDSISHSNLAYAVHFHPDSDGGAILRENLRFNVLHSQKLSHEITPHENDASPSRRLRIGYVSPDFRVHCQSLFTVPLLSRHDHEQFEIHCYANVPRPDAMTERLAEYADAWHPTAGMADKQVAQRVREDGIDILVDLTMHMSNGRPLLFARKPAPVQVAWLAYPGTTGLSAMDYRLTDPYLDPPGETDCHYSEQSIRLPNSFWCYDPLATEPLVNRLPLLNNGRVTFGCLNNFCKINDGTLALWARAMRAVPNSRLLLLAAPGEHRQRVLDRMSGGGIAAERIEFVEFRPRAQYLELYHRIDIGLDTFPYNGHTTSLDSYWMGVPVVTRVGQTAVGRAGWCQLSNLGLSELAAQSDDEWVGIVAGLAGDIGRLGGLRAGLRERLLCSPLCDGARFARDVEGAYRSMWRRWCENKARLFAAGDEARAAA